MKSYYIQLIRNGLTEGNVSGKYVGHIDEPLSREGIAQIEQMKSDYKYPPVDAVFASPLSRCTQTAKIIYPNCEPIVINGLIEYNFGEFEGKTAEELQNHPVFPDWLAGKKALSLRSARVMTNLQTESQPHSLKSLTDLLKPE